MCDSYKDKIYDIAVDTFEVACYMFPLEEWEIEDKQEQDFSGNRIRSVVNFEGSADGKMIITPSEELLSAIASNMLGVEEPSLEQKTGALCEITNIICGNTVPIFAQDDDVCYINPPKILKETDDIREGAEHMKRESLQVFLDEGPAKISVYYLIEERL